MLQTRKQCVTFVGRESETELSLTDEQVQSGEEIEKLIVENVVSMHKAKLS